MINSNKIAIISHINPDFDALASMYFINHIYPEADIILNGSPDINVRMFLKNYDYYFSFKKERNIDIKKYNKVIIIDTNNLERLGNFADLIKSGRLKIEAIYDHHPLEKNLNCDTKNVFISETGATITSIINKYIDVFNSLKLNEIELTLLLLGIYEDTGNFTFLNTTYLDFEISSYLIKKGANLHILSEYIKKEMTSSQIELQETLEKNLKKIDIMGCSVAISWATAKNYIPDLAVMVQQIKSFYNLNVFFAIVKMGNTVFIAGRSKISDFDIGKIMKEFDGGGHSDAGSASIRNGDIKIVEEKLIEVLKKNKNFYGRARDIMSHPVEVINYKLSMREAHKILNQLRLSSIPVVYDNGDIAGVIEISDLDKSLHNKELGDCEVITAVDTNYIAVSPDMDSSEVYNLMISKNKKRALVIEDDKLIGIIGHSDLLSMLSKKYQINLSLNHRVNKINYVEDLINNLDKEKLDYIKMIASIADELKINCFLVGGFVRDLILKIKNNDIDIVVESNAINFAMVLKERLKCDFKKSEKFQTATIFHGDFQVDIATARVEHYEAPGALPLVTQSRLRYDLFRRDFTMNALAIKINKEDFGLLYDYFGGYDDVKNRIIRILHNISFMDDPTRIFRALRFEQRLDFTIEEQTLNLIIRAIEANFISKIGNQRIKNELVLILKEEQPWKVLKRMKELSILSKLNQYFEDSEVIDENLFFRIAEFYFWFNNNHPEVKIDRWRIYLMAFLKTCSIQTAENFLETYCFSKDIKKLVFMQKTKEHLFKEKLDKENILKSEIYLFLHKLPIELILYELSANENPTIEKNIKIYLNELMNINIDFPFDYLKLKKIDDGKLIKLIVEKYKLDAIDNKFNEKNEAEKTNYLEFLINQFLT